MPTQEMQQRTYAICTLCSSGVNSNQYKCGKQKLYLESTLESKERIEKAMKSVEATLRSLPSHLRIKPSMLRRHRQDASYGGQTKRTLVACTRQFDDPILQGIPWTAKSITTRNGIHILHFTRTFYLCDECTAG